MNDEATELMKPQSKGRQDVREEPTEDGQAHEEANPGLREGTARATRHEEAYRTKTLYEEGGRSANNSLIKSILYSSKHYILFRNDKDSIEAETPDNPPPVIATAHNEARILEGLTERLTIVRKREARDMIAGALASTYAYVEAHAGTDVAEVRELFVEARAYIDKHKDEVAEVLGSGPDFAVYLLNNNTIRWCKVPLSARDNKAITEFENLRCVANIALRGEDRLDALKVLGAALATAFSVHEEAFERVFTGPRRLIQGRTESRLRTTLIGASVIGALLLTGALVIPWALNAKTITYVVPAGAGVLGASMSFLQRSNKIEIDPVVGIYGLIGESASRLIIGLVFGLLIVLLAKAELAFPAFKGSVPAIACFAFIGGFSERLVPNLISSVWSAHAKNKTTE